MQLGRKPRDDGNGLKRDYACGCGKTYLSYPALYLHLKIKHNGKQPTGTIMHKTVNIIIKQIINTEVHQTQSQNSQLNKFKENKYGQIPIQSFQKNSKHNDTSIVSMINMLEPNLSEILNFDEAKDVLISCLQYYPTGQSLPKIITLFSEQQILVGKLKFNDIQDLKLYEIFSQLFIKTFNKLCYNSYKLLTIYIFTYVQCLNQEALQTLQRLNILNENIEEIQEFCINKTGEHSLEIINEFIENYIQKALKRVQFEINIEKTILFCQLLSDWLYQNNFTNSKLQLNEEEFKDIKEEYQIPGNLVNQKIVANEIKQKSIQEEDLIYND